MWFGSGLMGDLREKGGQKGGIRDKLAFILCWHKNLWGVGAYYAPFILFAYKN